MLPCFQAVVSFIQLQNYLDLSLSVSECLACWSALPCLVYCTEPWDSAAEETGSFVVHN